MDPSAMLERRAPSSMRFVVLVLIAVALAGCSRVVGPRSFAVSTIGTDGAAWDVRLNDTSGRITAMTVDPQPAFKNATEEPFNVAESPGTLVVPWTGGDCDRETTFTVAASGDQIVILYKIDVAPGVCDARAITHQLVLETTPTIPANAVTLKRAP